MKAIWLLAFFIPTCLVAMGQENGDWPQWRGPSRDGTVIASKTAWPDRLSEERLTRNWRIDLGLSFSSPIVAGDRVYTVETTDKHEVARALDRTTGKQVWESKWAGEMNVPFFAWKMGSWIRSTPALDVASESLFVGGMRDIVVCLNIKDGKERWRVDFVERYKAPLPSFGMVSSPLVDGDFLYVQAGGGMVKLKKATGESVWRALADGGGMNGSAFSSPMIATIHGQRQCLVQTRAVLAGLDLETGKALWSVPVPAFRGMNIINPVLVDNSRIFTSSYGGGSLLFEIEKSQNGDWSVKQVWKNSVEGYMGTPAVIGGHVYLHGRDQKFRCLDLANGEVKWATGERFGEYWSMVTRQENILALDQRGELLLIHATPEKFELLDRRKIATQETWAHVAVTGQQIWVREMRGLALWDWK